MTEAEIIENLLKRLLDYPPFIGKLNSRLDELKGTNLPEGTEEQPFSIYPQSIEGFLRYVKGLCFKLEEAKLFGPGYDIGMEAETFKADMILCVPIYADTEHEPIQVATLRLSSVNSYIKDPCYGYICWMSHPRVISGVEADEAALDKALKYAVNLAK